MELDSCWRTRTIAEAQSQGYRHLRVTCAGCGRITDIPWQMLLGRSRVTPESFIGNVPLRCQSCGRTAPSIGVGHRGEAQRLSGHPFQK
jgi:ribosomal protein S27E